MQPKKIGVLTSGSGCAGLNAVIRAIAFRAIQGFGWEVYGIRKGRLGLMERRVDYEQLPLGLSTANILRMGWTTLGSVVSGNPLEFPMDVNPVRGRSEGIIDGYRELGLDALIGIPKTIDNDFGRTENSMGYVTAVDLLAGEGLISWSYGLTRILSISRWEKASGISRVSIPVVCWFTPHWASAFTSGQNQKVKARECWRIDG